MAEEGGGAIREMLAVFGFGVDTSDLKKGESQLSDFADKVKRVAQGLAAAFAVDAIYSWAESNVKAMTSVEHQAARLGISTDEVQAYTFAAKALGMESEQLLNSMGRLQISQQAAAKGGKEQGAAFSALGVHVKDASGHFKEADQLFMEVADGISKMTDPGKAAAAAVALFGRQGRELLPILKQGSKGLDELIETYHQLGGGFTDEAIEKSKAFEKQQAILGVVMNKVKSVILEGLLPVITKIVTWVGKGVHAFSEMASKSNILQSAFYVLGIAAAAFAVPMLAAAAPILLMAAGLAGLVLIVDSFITMMNGGKSVIGDTLDKIFGKDAHVDIVEKIKDTWDEIKNIFATLSGYVHKVVQGFEEMQNASERIGVIMRAVSKGEDPGKALQQHELDKLKGESSGPSDEEKDFYRRRNAVAHGRVFRSGDETQAQAELKANIIRSQNPGLSPEFGPLPFIPGVTPPAAKVPVHRPLVAHGHGAGHRGERHVVDVNVKHDQGVIVETTKKVIKEHNAYAKANLERAPTR